ncbi:MAG: hypothetical protein JF603_02735 [Acidobacteria bacterium]|nr:hypothetical protein [Acidobacteriota bacterium]
MVLRSARPPVTAPVVYQAVYRDRPGRRWVTLTAIAATDTGGPGGSPEEFRTADGARATLTHKEHVESWWFAVRADSHIKVDATFQGFTHDEALAAAKTIHPAAGSGPDAFELDPGAGMTRTLAGSPPWKAHRMTISYADRPGSGRYLQIDTYRTTAAITDLFRANSILDRIVSVRGHKAVVLRPGPATTTTAVAWTEGPGVVVSVSTKGLGASATTKIARSLRQVSDATWKQQTSRVPR